MTYNVFLSFSMDDIFRVCLFRAQAKNKQLPLEFRDHSVKEPFDERWKTQVSEKINRCSLTICLIGDKTYKSEAVNWELEKSLQLGKGLMGVYLIDSNPRLPSTLIINSIKVVPWKRLRKVNGTISEKRPFCQRKAVP